jgi:hypothetical protein
MENTLATQFPKNEYIHRLLYLAEKMDIAFSESPEPERWLYHPGRRCIYAWLPDLKDQSLSYLVVVIAHELGHAMDFDRHPDLIEAIAHLHYSEMPVELEFKAFINGYLILEKLDIPVSLSQYCQMIEPPMDAKVKDALLEAKYQSA